MKDPLVTSGGRAGDEGRVGDDVAPVLGLFSDDGALEPRGAEPDLAGSELY